MLQNARFDVSIIGGGPAGSTAAICLRKAGFNVCLIERKIFPRETLCGEFLSKEVIKIVSSIELDGEFRKLNPNPIDSFRIVNQNGKEFTSKLDFTGFGLKRGCFDHMLLGYVRDLGVEVFQPAKATGIKINGNTYFIDIELADSIISIEADNVIAAYGKQNILDKQLNRRFVNYKSCLNGVKFHISKSDLNDFPYNEIRIYTGKDIYCGVNAVNEDTVTVCFLENRRDFHYSAKEHLKELIANHRVFASLFKPGFAGQLNQLPVYGTGNIYFGWRELISNGIYMAGDSSHVIAPLAGDGIGMAMQGAILLADILTEQKQYKLSRRKTEQNYKERWRRLFSRRIFIASAAQYVLMNNILRSIVFNLPFNADAIVNLLIRNTRGL